MINKNKICRKLSNEYKPDMDLNGAIGLYLKEIDKEELLSRDAEKKLAILTKRGDLDARQRLIKSNLRFVVSIAKKYQNKGMPLIDLINEGNLGLITAVEKFDYTKGYHFISYAVWWIKQSILKALAEKTRLVRLPLNRIQQLYNFQKYTKERYHIGANSISNNELANVFGVDIKSVNAIINAASYSSLEAPINDDKKQTSLKDIIKDEKLNKPENAAFDNALKVSINKIFEILTEKEKSVLIHRYGLNGVENKTLREIGKIFNLTKERIRQIEKKAIKKLKYNSGAKYLKEYLTN